MSRTVVFGGTFDPIHAGHLHAARTVAAACGSSVEMVLAARPGHRNVPAADIEDRWAMLEIACRGDDRLDPSRIEIDRPGRSYAVDTLEELGARCDRPVVWVIGTDAVALTRSWHRAGELADLCSFLVLERPDVDSAGGDCALAVPVGFEQVGSVRALFEKSGRIHVLKRKMRGLSATEIRSRIARGEDVDRLLPPGVWTYIKERRLYQV